MGAEACPWCKRDDCGCGVQLKVGDRVYGRFRILGGGDPHLLGRVYRALDGDRGRTVRLLRIRPDIVVGAPARRRFQDGLRMGLGVRVEGVSALLGFAVPDTVVHGWVPGRGLEPIVRARRARKGPGFAWSEVLPLLEGLVEALERLPAAHGDVGLHSVALPRTKAGAWSRPTDRTSEVPREAGSWSGPTDRTSEVPTEAGCWSRPTDRTSEVPTEAGCWSRPTLLDWGLAHGVGAEVRRIAVERAGGWVQARLPPEIGRMPEVGSGLHPDPRSDVYGLAAVAWELLTLRPPELGPPATMPEQPDWDGPMRAVRAGLRVDPELRPAGPRVWLRSVQRALHAAPVRPRQADANDPCGQRMNVDPRGDGPSNPRGQRMNSDPPRVGGGRLETGDGSDPLRCLDPGPDRFDETRPVWVDPVPEPPTRPVLNPWAVRGAVFLWSVAVAFAFVTGLLAWVAPV